MTTDDPAALSRRAPLREVAAAAGVATSTVSRSLRDDPQISERTRDAIKRIAAEFQYIPNASARTLAGSSSRMLGLVVPDVTDPVHGQVVHGFEAAARRHGYAVIIASSGYDAAQELVALHAFTANQVVGMASFGGTLSPAALQSQPIGNLLFMNPENLDEVGPGGERGLITFDDAGGMEEAVRTAVSMGNRRLGFLVGPARASGVRRQATVMRVAAELGLPPVRTIEGADAHPDVAGRRIRRERLDAVLCYDDQRALVLLDALRTAGIRVPEDVGVIGFDDIPQAAISNPRLTTVSVPHADVGMLAAENLIEGRSGVLPASTRFSARLVVRESLGRGSQAEVR
jgi:LacI family transcriptional regulator